MGSVVYIGVSLGCGLRSAKMTMGVDV